MTKDELIRLKNIISCLALTTVIAGSVVTSKYKDDSDIINAYIYELDNDNNCVELKASINSIKNNHLMDNYIGESIKIVDANNNYVIEKVDINGNNSTSYAYINGYNSSNKPIIINVSEDNYYKVFNIVNSDIKRKKLVK